MGNGDGEANEPGDDQEELGAGRSLRNRLRDAEKFGGAQNQGGGCARSMVLITRFRGGCVRRCDRAGSKPSRGRAASSSAKGLRVTPLHKSYARG